MTAQPDHCQQAVRQADRDVYVSVLFAPEQHRPALYALHAFSLDLARVRAITSEAIAGEIRLQWWREVLQGERSGEAAAHPIACALLSASQDYSFDTASLVAQIDARQFDIYNESMATVAELEAYFAAAYGPTFHLAARILSAQDNASGCLGRAACAYGYFHLLRQFAEHSARGQAFVPDEIVQQHGASRVDVFSGRMTPEWFAALAAMRERACAHLDAAAVLVRGIPQSILPAILPLAVVRPTFELMDKSIYDPLRPVTLSALRRLWLIWRASKDPHRIFG